MSKAYEIITKLSAPDRVEELSKQLNGGRELLSGGMAEFSSAPGYDGECACVYYLTWSTDKHLFGLEVTEHKPLPQRCRGLSKDPYDGDRYLWSLDNRPSKTWIGAIAIIDGGATVDQTEIAQALENVFVDEGGIAITDDRC